MATSKDPAEMFAAALKETEAQRRAAAARKAEADGRERELKAARAELDAAIEAVRSSKASGRGRAEADAAWKVAKARVIELETGNRPSWAPAPAAEPQHDEPQAEAAQGEGVAADDAEAVAEGQPASE